ncbi:5'-methylthioadenosine/adenosylhomocysteine nucleosidase [Desulforhabdus amnigena]|jgi:adenosylhomocysteine nucleosidase|nr:5'-methylthioadenosine/adenosylhomocysteine nucleosidase [Desulforhabdus amnigena]NLJ29543.1 5'-methylthioadenosine/adenosylhomocysteine nucleosidase [Deltaproteobacteria bacterium]
MAGLRSSAVIFAIILTLWVPRLASADIGLICTLQGELQEALGHMKTEQRFHEAERDFYRGIMEGKRVVLVRSPMGKVNNAITAQLLASRFHVDRIVSIGFAGAIDPSLEVGSVVVSERTLQHDFGVTKPYGDVWELPPTLGKPAEAEAGGWASSRGYAYGTILTGDRFVAAKEKRDWLRKKFSASAVDMGAAAIQEVCIQNGIPCLFIRIISDKAGSDARDHFDRSAQSVNYKSVEVLKEFLGHSNLPRRSR